jgi:hypothetical protein
VTLRDPTGREIVVDRLDAERAIDASAVGQMLWCFNLESTVWRTTSDGRAIQPTTFHEHAADSAQRRAWALLVFSQPASRSS